MNAELAAELLSSMAYKPGSQVIAAAVDSGTVLFGMEFDTYDSTPEPDGYQPPVTITTPPILIDVTSLDTEGVLGAGLNAILKVEEHETREFWRPRSGIIAPFHPHSKSGEAAWQRVRDDSSATVLYPPANGR